ncbi:DUF5367 family protein [Mesobacillus foraminis]|nr:DUF5367 family protein [Mesobacillus foraminis]
MELCYVIWGILLWGAATFIFRFFGHQFLLPDEPLLLLLMFLFAVPVIAAAVYPYYHARKAPVTEWLSAAVQIALPGMLLDIFSVVFYRNVFPNLQPDTGPLFAAWLLWAYSLLLLSGFSFKK